jgi:hypothetical protein
VPAKLVIGDRTQAVLLLVEGPGMGEILDLAFPGFFRTVRRRLGESRKTRD